ncbi:hypothetical protein [Nitrosomonas sp.]|uniref:hypothetical protein n=1 Tax=Nitrosomonas sp. TaxID=42353 RepID=UPI0032EE6906
MAKSYSDRQMKAEVKEQEFFFPKANPPQTISAVSLEEAEKKLVVLSDKEVKND